jgi:hypothetical protein
MLLTLASLLFTQPVAARRANMVVTIAAGTPVRLSTSKLIANRILIQPIEGCSSCGVVYVMADIPSGTTPSASNAAHVAASLCAASAAAPGCTYSDPSVVQQGASSTIDLSLIWIDGAHTGDTVRISYDERL